MGFPIQISADHLVFANPRRFSQLITSFFGSQCLGIHPVLFSLNHPRIPPGETLACVSLSSLCGCLHPQPQMSYSLIAICGFQGTIRIRGDVRSQRSERSPQRPDRKEPESSICLSFRGREKAAYPPRLPSFPLGKAKSAIRPGGHEPPVLFAEPLEKMSGIHLSSHAVASVVFSAARGLTVVFGMGTGVSPRRIDTRHSLDLIKNRILHRPLLYP